MEEQLNKACGVVSASKEKFIIQPFFLGSLSFLGSCMFLHRILRAPGSASCSKVLSGESSNGCGGVQCGQQKYEVVITSTELSLNSLWDRATGVDGQLVGSGAWQADSAFRSQPSSCSRKQVAAGKSSSLY